MSSRLRSLGLRAAFLLSFLAAALAVRVTVAKPSFPFVLLDSFDKALARVTEAAEKRIAELEHRVEASERARSRVREGRTDAPAPDTAPQDAAPVAPRTRGTVFALLERLDGEITVACDAATDLLDTELVLVDQLSELRRASVRGCIERLIVKAHDDRACARDPGERAEYEATLERLREVRELVS